jgi:hypothetical protein
MIKFNCFKKNTDLEVTKHIVLLKIISFNLVYTGRFIMYSGITKMFDRKTIGHVIFFFGEMSKTGYSSHHCHVTSLT